ncbi:MAG: hypothetical protein RL610_114 [Pseudomonadota bacterium]|jgi:hypothetical protein
MLAEIKPIAKIDVMKVLYIDPLMYSVGDTSLSSEALVECQIIEQK